MKAVWRGGRRLCANTKENRHLVNSAPFFLSINAQTWIPAETKARLLEWQIRSDLMQYAARAVPSLSMDDIKNYQPKNPGKATTLGEFYPSPPPRTSPPAS